jgi:hypothetical protein
MTDIRAITDIHEVDPVEMAGVEGGFFVADGYCGTYVPGLPIPTPPLPIVIGSVINVLPAGLAAGGTISPGL